LNVLTANMLSTLIWAGGSGTTAGAGTGEMAVDCSLGLNRVGNCRMSSIPSPSSCEESTVPRSSVSQDSSRPEALSENGEDVWARLLLALPSALVVEPGGEMFSP